MQTRSFKWEDKTVLDAAIIAGLTAVFLAGAVPLIRGAVIRQRTAECARKIMLAAEAFDFYAACNGSYPPSPGVLPQADTAMRSVFSVFNIDWWERETELGGQWNWELGEKESCSVIIRGSGISERRMVQLDGLLDDGDLGTGSFQRRGALYFYTIKNQYPLRGHVL